MTSAPTDLRSDWAAWHAEREEQLRAPHGWLSLTALHWLTPHLAPVPDLPGRWSATGEGVTIAAVAGDGLVVRGPGGPRPVDGTVVLHPVDGLPGELVEFGELVVEVARRTDAHVLRVRDPRAPTRTGFTGVPAFPVDPRWVLDGRFEPYAQPRTITVDAVVDGVQHYPTASGTVRFTLDGREHALVALRGRDGGLTLHFRDATSGVSTYRGGRSLQATDPDADGRLRLDFNRTVNLPCVFTDFATCPLPPADNVLDVAVEAGERS